MTGGPSAAERAARALVRLAARIAPARSELLREWEAELAHRFHPPPPRRPPGARQRLALVYRALFALVDAVHIRMQEMTVDSLVKDLRFAARTLRRRPGFTLLAVFTVALGIGANTAIFSVVNAVLLRPLPYPEPDGLVMVWEAEAARGWDRVPASAEDYLTWREEARSFSALAGTQNASYALTGDGEPERVTGLRVTADFFDVFGVRPALGRTFGPEANVDGKDRVVVLSHGLWERRWGGDPSVVGRTVRIDEEAYRVVGVMPAGFRFPSAAQLWTPLVFQEAQLQDRNWHFLLVLGRLADGVPVEAARAEMATLGARLADEYPDSNGGWAVDVKPLHGEMTQSVRGMLLVLLGAVGFVLLIACVNVANLLLVRATRRARELAVRRALGAGRARLVRQLLTESLLLSGAGAAVGLLMAWAGLDALVALSPLTVPGGGEVTVDPTVLALTAAAALATGLLFGAAPAVSVWRRDLQAPLKEGGRSGTERGGNRVRSVLVMAEVALALVLVTGASLMVRSVGRLLRTDVGVDAEGLLLAEFSLPPASYPDAPSQIAFYDELLGRLGATPGVEAAALTPVAPPASGGQFHVRIEGVHDAWTMDLPVARARSVNPGFFDAMGIPLLRGRALSADDDGDAEWVVVVDRAFADAYFPGEDPVGREIRTLVDRARRVVGVVGDVANAGIGQAAGPTTYFPYRQMPLGSTQTVAVRTSGEPSAFAPALRDAIWGLDPDLPLVSVETLEDRLAGSVASPRFNASLLGLFAVLALLLAGVGIYGVMAYVVSERTPELGLRMALGATAPELRVLVLRQALVLAAGGVVLGVGASLALTRTLESFLFEVEPGDPLTLAAVAAVLCAVAAGASLVPAWRASRLDPRSALVGD